MNIEEQRKVFKEWFKSQYPHLYSDYLNRNTVALAVFTASMEAWLASANREGYKLVPVEPTYKQLDAIKDSCVAIHKAELSDLEAHGAYKAMIGEETK